MKFRVLFALMSFMVVGCGTRPARDRTPEAIYYDLTGVWEQYSLDTQNPSATTCKDVLYLNTDHTFIRTYSCSAQGRSLSDQKFSGYYEVIGDRIQFNYVHQQAEVFAFSLSGNELKLIKSDQAFQYYKKPNEA